MHLVGFIISNYHDARSLECYNNNGNITDAFLVRFLKYFYNPYFYVNALLVAYIVDFVYFKNLVLRHFLQYQIL